MIDFEEIYTAYYPAIFRFCFKKLRHTEQAEDLAQNTFLSFYGALPTLEQRTNANIKAYLYRIATNKVIDFTRHEKIIEFAVLDYERPSPHDFTEQIAMREALTQTLSQLTPFHRIALLAWMQDKSGKEQGSGFKMTASRAIREFRESYRRQQEAS